MQKRSLKYDGSNRFIKKDFQRLKRWKSLSKDIYSCYKITDGILKELPWPPPLNVLGGLITKIECSYGTLLCYKDRVAISNPSLSPSRGARLIFAIAKETFIPLIVYGACEEGGPYKVNGKKFLLTKSNLGKIIKEKIKFL